MQSINLDGLKAQLQLLTEKYRYLDLPVDQTRHELLATAEEPLKTELRQTFDRLEELARTPYVLYGAVMGFVPEGTLLHWLHFLVVSGKVASSDEAVDRLLQFYSSKVLVTDVYVVLAGLDAISFGTQIEQAGFTIGRVVENGYVDGRLMSYKCTAGDIFIKKRCNLSIGFGADANIDGLQQPHIVHAAILGPLRSQLQLLEANCRSAIRPFAYHLRFDPLTTPLAQSFNKMMEIDSSRPFIRGERPCITGGDIALLWDKYAALPTSTKDQLSVPLRWISRSLRAEEPIDAMVAVGTALEALFL